VEVEDSGLVSRFVRYRLRMEKTGRWYEGSSFLVCGVGIWL